MKLYVSLFYAVILTLNILPSLASCPIRFHSVIDSSAERCYPQKGIKAQLRSTPVNFLYILSFVGGPSPFTGVSDLASHITIKINNPSSSTTIYSSSYGAIQLNEDGSLFMIAFNLNQIPYSSSFHISFTDFTTDNTRPSYIKSFDDLLTRPTSAISTSDAQLNSALLNIDYYLEIAWIVVALVNPHWILYMDAKLYRETFDLLKYVNVQHEPFLSEFFKSNDKKFAGLKVPNVFGIQILGNGFASEWAKDAQTVIENIDITQGQVDDFKIASDYKVHENLIFPLFLDTYGAQLTFILGLLVICLFYEASFRLISKKYSEDNLFYRIVFYTRKVLWNFTLMNVIGSFQSLTFYFVVQVCGFMDYSNLHNKISFAISVGVTAIILFAVPFYIIRTSKKNVRESDVTSVINASERRLPTPFYSHMLTYLKSDKIVYPLTILFGMFRSIIFTLIVVLGNGFPIAQTATLLGVTLLFLLYLIIFRPYAKTFYNIIKITYEVTIFIITGFLLAIALNDNNMNYSHSLRTQLAHALLILWIAIPGLTIIFGMFAFGHYYFGYQEAQKGNIVKPSRIVPTNNVAIEMGDFKKGSPPKDPFTARTNPNETGALIAGEKSLFPMGKHDKAKASDDEHTERPKHLGSNYKLDNFSTRMKSPQSQFDLGHESSPEDLGLIHRTEGTKTTPSRNNRRKYYCAKRAKIRSRSQKVY